MEWKEQAEKLFDEGYSYKKISEVLRKKRDMVTKHLKSTGRHREVSPKVIEANRQKAEKVAETLKEKYKDQKEYFVCKLCGKESEVKGNTANIYCSRECAFIDYENWGFKSEGRVCENCGASYKRGKNERFCSDDCKNEYYTKTCQYCGKQFSSYKRVYCDECESKARSKAPPPIECAICNEVFQPYSSKNKYCEKCKKEAQRITRKKYMKTPKGKEGKRAGRRKRRAYKRETVTEPYIEGYIYERYNWRCQLCGGKIDKRLTTPHPKSATIDHITPLSKGGTDTADNVWPAHFMCNSRKGDRNIMANEQGQLVLV